MKLKVNTEIALTHLLTRKKQTMVASLGVTVGIGIFIFMISLVVGFNRYSDESLFKAVPHIRIYKDDILSRPLMPFIDSVYETVIVNPKIANLTKSLINPDKILADFKKQDYVLTVAPQVSASLFYNNGTSQINGIASGVNIMEANDMFNIQSTMLAGDVSNLLTLPNGIIIGVGIADHLNIQLNDNINITSAIGVIKVMKVVGIFKTSNSAIDKTKSYTTLVVAQQLLHQSTSYVTDILVNIKDPNKAPEYAKRFENLTNYKIEDWQAANEQTMASNKTRKVMFGAISIAILLVAAFGIYNIINMTIKEKLNDIAILKATGFKGKDVINIFIKETLIMGFIGTSFGLVLAAILIKIVSGIYIGGDREYFPIGFETPIFIMGSIIGMLVTLGAGYIPALNAAKVDPIEIFRK
ncbi:MAG: ABC transporter permease [Saprospiraceae bacterium]|nr:ABC transporter permease [Saprospiraceae bacterium]MDP4700624.1 ABC transporter permease [Saprospiraceae bacterium]MDP4809607.1 ABC transporter permease [Saprospiraceae bacterium]MDP4813222.1 ABC transporter permease [Saprospiraceae bacterium]MDP5047397.1 ABC transporter permease [Saprospiraceae bacterium]